MVSIAELRPLLSGPPGKRYLLILWFYCDASYDSDPNLDPTGVVANRYVPRTFVVGGFLATDRIWGRIEDEWAECNKWAGVSRYRAAAVNSRTGEFEGWKKEKRDEYSARLLKALGRHGTELCAVSMGLKIRDYERIISEEGRRKWGEPNVVCFKQCVSYIAQLMGNLGPAYRFSTIVDRGDDLNGVGDCFYGMKDSKRWGFGHRLFICTAADAEDLIPLQTADLIAYETFKYLHSDRDPELVRHALKAILPHNKVLGKWWNAERLEGMKDLLEDAQVGPSGFIALWDNEDLEKERFIVG